MKKNVNDVFKSNDPVLSAQHFHPGWSKADQERFVANRIARKVLEPEFIQWDAGYKPKFNSNTKRRDVAYLGDNATKIHSRYTFEIGADKDKNLRHDLTKVWTPWFECDCVEVLNEISVASKKLRLSFSNSVSSLLYVESLEEFRAVERVLARLWKLQKRKAREYMFFDSAWKDSLDPDDKDYRDAFIAIQRNSLRKLVERAPRSAMPVQGRML